jgi:hypothetical protein
MTRTKNKSAAEVRLRPAQKARACGDTSTQARFIAPFAYCSKIWITDI